MVTQADGTAIDVLIWKYGGSGIISLLREIDIFLVIFIECSLCAVERHPLERKREKMSAKLSIGLELTGLLDSGLAYIFLVCPSACCEVAWGSEESGPRAQRLGLAYRLRPDCGKEIVAVMKLLQDWSDALSEQLANVVEAKLSEGRGIAQ